MRGILGGFKCFAMRNRGMTAQAREVLKRLILQGTLQHGVDWGKVQENDVGRNAISLTVTKVACPVKTDRMLVVMALGDFLNTQPGWERVSLAGQNVQLAYDLRNSVIGDDEFTTAAKLEVQVRSKNNSTAPGITWGNVKIIGNTHPLIFGLEVAKTEDMSLEAWNEQLSAVTLFVNDHVGWERFNVCRKISARERELRVSVIGGEELTIAAKLEVQVMIDNKSTAHGITWTNVKIMSKTHPSIFGLEVLVTKDMPLVTRLEQLVAVLAFVNNHEAWERFSRREKVIDVIGLRVNHSKKKKGV